MVRKRVLAVLGGLMLLLLLGGCRSRPQTMAAPPTVTPGVY